MTELKDRRYYLLDQVLDCLDSPQDLQNYCFVLMQNLYLKNLLFVPSMSKTDITFICIIVKLRFPDN